MIIGNKKVTFKKVCFLSCMERKADAANLTNGLLVLRFSAYIRFVSLRFSAFLYKKSLRISSIVPMLMCSLIGNL